MDSEKSLLRGQSLTFLPLSPKPMDAKPKQKTHRKADQNRSRARRRCHPAINDCSDGSQDDVDCQKSPERYSKGIESGEVHQQENNQVTDNSRRNHRVERVAENQDGTAFVLPAVVQQQQGDNDYRNAANQRNCIASQVLHKKVFLFEFFEVLFGSALDHIKKHSPPQPVQFSAVFLDAIAIPKYCQHLALILEAKLAWVREQEDTEESFCFRH